METTQILICSGKIRFTSPQHAIETQTLLLAHGFRFFSGSQEPRPGAIGVMWRAHEIRTAANEHAFKAYGAPLVDAPTEMKRTKNPAPKPVYTPEQRKAQAQKAGLRHKEVVYNRVIALVPIVTTALNNIGQYEPNLYGTNSRCQARAVAWDNLYKECVRLNGEVPAEGTLRTAIRRVLAEKGKPFMVPDSRRTTRAMQSV